VPWYRLPLNIRAQFARRIDDAKVSIRAGDTSVKSQHRRIPANTIVQWSCGDSGDLMRTTIPVQELHMTRPLSSLDLTDARRMIAAGERKAVELGIPYNIAVADAGGGLVAHVRMDGAWLGSVDIAINKAWTARAFDVSTEDLSHLAQSGQQGFGLNTTNDSRVVIFGGGIPIKVDGVVVGAVGASGGSVEQDVAVARAASDAF
jgi:uncharacterized protein GlcG (DUF336 family)